MAVHADYPGLTVEIYVDGKPLEEFKNPEEEDVPKTTTRYVECRSGAEFAIHTNFTSSFKPMDMSVRAYLDGSKVDGIVLYKHRLLDNVHIQSRMEWKEDETWRSSKFLFSDINVVEEKDSISPWEDPKFLESTGIISVVLAPILRMKEKYNPRGKKAILPEIGPISEEAIKGDLRSHKIGLAPDTAVAPGPRFTIKTTKEPLVTFRFNYRSITALKSLGMIPRSPSPSPVPEPELIKKEELPEPTPNIVRNVVSPTATPRPKTASLAPQRQNSTPPTPRDQPKLTKKDMLILIKHYRGSSDGLEGLPEKDLAILLCSYQNDEAKDMLIKQEPVAPESRVRVKREPVDDGATRGQAKKRKPEVIVLDD